MNNFYYNRQFIAGPQRLDGPPNWKCVSFAGSMNIHCNPNLIVSASGDESVEILVLGDILDPSRPERKNEDIVNNLKESATGFACIEEMTSSLGGRWLMFVRIGVEQRLYPDATGQRSAFFAILTSADPVWIASQPMLLRDYLGIEIVSRPFDDFPDHGDARWWPGMATPFEQTFRLLPNHYLDLKTGEACRFWPTRTISTVTTDTAALKIAEIISGTLKALAYRGKLWLPLTGGYDSRTLYAAAIRSKTDFDIALVVNPDTPRHDISIPKKLARMFHKRITFLQQRDLSEEFIETYKRNMGYMYWDNSSVKIQTFGDFKADYLINSVGSEILRRFFWAKHDRVEIPEVSEISRLTHHGGSPTAIKELARWVNSVPSDLDISILDLLHWEIRLGCWGSHALLSMSTVQEIIGPYNCRALLELGLGTPCEDRGPPYRLHRMICDASIPSLSQIAFNRTLRDDVRDRLKRVLPWRIQTAWRAARWRRAGLERSFNYTEQENNSFPASINDIPRSGGI